ERSNSSSQRLSDANSSRMAAAKASCSASGSLEAASNAFLRALVISAPVRRTIGNLIPCCAGPPGIRSGFAKISKVAIEPQSGDLDGQRTTMKTERLLILLTAVNAGLFSYQMVRPRPSTAATTDV